MKRAAMWMLGWGSRDSHEQKMNAQQEVELGEVLQQLRHDRHAASAALLDLPGIADASSVKQKGTRLLERMEGMQLAQRDTNWVRVLHLCLLQNQDATNLRELAQLMATKEQWDFLAKHFNRLNVQEILGDLRIKDLEALYTASKQHASSHVATPPTAKRRRLAHHAGASSNELALALADTTENNETNPAHDHKIRQVGEALAAKLVCCEEDSGLPDKLSRLRDLLVELYESSHDHSYVTRLSELISSSCEHIDLPTWAETADLDLLQVVLDEFNLVARLKETSLGAIISAEGEAETALVHRADENAELKMRLAMVACVLGERQIANGRLEEAGEAFRQARQLDNNRPNATKSLLQVLLAQHKLNPLDVCHLELVELLAVQAEWAELVERYDSLRPALREVFSTWNAEQLHELAGALENGDRTVEAAEANVAVALRNEQAGRQSLAYKHFRHAFDQNPGNRDAEAGVCRLALAAGCVEDAAAELLLKPTSRLDARVKAVVQLLTRHAETKADEAQGQLRMYCDQRLAQLGNPEKVTGNQLTLAAPMCEASASTVAGLAASCQCLGQPASSKASQVTSEQATPQGEHADTQTLETPAKSADASTRKPPDGQRLRKKFPGKVPVICLPVAFDISRESDQFLIKFKFLVQETMPCGELKNMLHRKIALTAAGKGALLGPDDFADPGSEPADSAMPLGKLYEAYPADDACLHLQYSIVKTIGGALGAEIFPSSSAPVSKRQPSQSWAPSQKVGIVRSPALDHARTVTPSAA